MRVILGLYWGYIGVCWNENKMETTVPWQGLHAVVFITANCQVQNTSSPALFRPPHDHQSSGGGVCQQGWICSLNPKA